MLQNISAKSTSQDGLIANNSINSFIEIITGMGPIFIIIIIFYFLLIRPQQKKMRAHQETVKNLKKNDHVITAGGLLAKIVKVGDKSDIITAEIAKDVRVEIKRHTISEVIKNKK